MRKKWLLAYGAVGLVALSTVATALAAGGKSHHHYGTAATSSASGSGEGSGSAQGGPPPGGPGGGGPGGGPGGPPAVHSESVVLDKAGTAFITVTTDSGIVKSVEASAGKLTITEGTKTVTYKSVTLTIPSEAKVTLDGKTSSLSSLSEGDHVTVTSSSEGTTVLAADSSFQPEGQSGHGGPQGGPGQGGKGGPPPGGPGGKSPGTTGPTGPTRG